MVQVKNAVNYSFRQKFKPSIKNGVGWNIDWERTATARAGVLQDGVPKTGRKGGGQW